MEDHAGVYLDHKMELLKARVKNRQQAVENDYVEEYVDINGIPEYFMHYPAEESDSVILFVHGGPGYANAYYSYIYKPKNKPFNLVYYDQRGAGKTQLKTPVTAEEVKFETLMQDLYESIKYLRKKYPGKKLILLGHSWGSVLGIEYVKRYQNTEDSVDAYIGCGQVINFKKQEYRAKEHLLKTVMATGKPEALEEYKACGDYPYNLNPENGMQEVMRFRNLQDKYGDVGYIDTDPITEDWLINSPTFGEADMDVLKNYLYVNSHLIATTLAEYEVDDLKEISIPMYFIQGKRDFQTESTYCEEYYNTISAPDKEFFWLENCGHLSYLEEPDTYNHILEEVCGRVRKVYAEK